MRESCMVNLFIPSIAQNRACYANGPALCIRAELAEIYVTRVIERIQGGCYFQITEFTQSKPSGYCKIVIIYYYSPGCLEGRF